MEDKFKKGIDLFNDAKYHEAHDVWEALWTEVNENDSYRSFYQGLIQAAVSLYLYEQKRGTGHKKLLEKSIAHLLNYEPVALGVNVSSFILDLKRNKPPCIKINFVS